MSDDSTTMIASADSIRRLHEARWGADADNYSSELVQQLDKARWAHVDAMEGIHRRAGDRALTASEQRQFDAHERERDALQRALDDVARAELTFKREMQERVAERRAKWGSVSVSPTGFGSHDLRDDSPTGVIRRANDLLERSAGDSLSTDGAERLAAVMVDERGADAARIVLARSTPAYESAFAKLLTAPDPSRAFFGFTAQEMDAFAQVEQVRASLSLTTAGALLPLAYDPNVAALTSDGSANPMRRLAKVAFANTSPHRAVTSAGVTANWIAEGSAISDGSPSFTGVDISLGSLKAWITSSYELFQDAGQELMANLPMILADARDTAENAAFISGSGSNAPVGIITAISATAACTVTATTRGAFTSASSADVFALLNALPARSRQSSKAAVFANNETITKVRQMIVGTGGIPIVDVPGSVPSVTGIPWYEATSIVAATTSGNILAVAGDFSRYCIVDHVAGPALEYVNSVHDGDGKPLAQRGWIYMARVGGDSLDDARFRYLLA